LHQGAVINLVFMKARWGCQISSQSDLQSLLCIKLKPIIMQM